MNFFKNHNFHTEKGMTLIEILIACVIITGGLLAIVQTYGIYVKYALNHDKKVQATYLLEEGIEAMTFLREKGWAANISTISTATTSLYFTGTTWTISSTTNEYIDGGTFVRNVKVDPVLRDGAGKISSSGSTDAGTKLVTVTVSYKQSSGTTTDRISKYLVNIYNN